MTFQIGDTVEAAVDSHLVTDVSSDGNWVHLNNCLVATPAMILRKVEPSIPVSKLREACEEVLGSAELDLQHEAECMRQQGITKQKYAEWFFRELTGEPLRKETP